MSDSSGIGKKMIALMDEVGYVQKDKANAFHKYRYVSAEAVMKKVQPAMVKLGLLFSEKIEILERIGPLVTLKVTGTISDIDSQGMVVSQGIGSGSDTGDKATMKALTAARKYFWMGVLALATGDDPEADHKTDEIAATAPPFSPEDESQEAPDLGNLDGIESLEALRLVYEKHKESWARANRMPEYNRLFAAKKRELQERSANA